MLVMKDSGVRKLFSSLIFLCLIILGSCVHADEDSDFVRFSDCPSSPNCVSSLSDPLDEVHYIEPFMFSSGLSDVFEGLLLYLENQEDVEIIVLEEGKYIHAVFTSKFFRFKDDVEFSFRDSAETGIIVDIQSRSRIGYSDMGVNRKRMEEIRFILRTELE